MKKEGANRNFFFLRNENGNNLLCLMQEGKNCIYIFFKILF
jgi:hypothetical protein